jgi:hypothetical protein
MICPLCKEEVMDGAVKCKHCKSMINEVVQEAQVGHKSVIPAEIRQELKKYDEILTLSCLECGYEGQMGVIGTEIPWYLTWWVLIPLFLTGVGVIPAVGLGIWRSVETRHKVVCPSCKNVLLQTK